MIGDRKMNRGRGIPGFACEGEARGKPKGNSNTHNCCKAFGKEDPSSGVAPVLGVAWRSPSWEPKTDPTPMTACG